MKNPLGKFEDHPSYKLHQKQMWTQILLPIIITTLIFVGVIVITCLATFRGHGDVNRWAAISTIWLLLPIMIAGLILLVLLLAMIYLIARATSMIPSYSYQAQRIFYRIKAYVERIASMFRKPVLALQEITKLVRQYIENATKTTPG